MRIEARIEIARPRDEVFEFVADNANDPKWCRKVKAVQPLGHGRWAVWHKPIPLRPTVRLETSHVRTNPPAYLAICEEDYASIFSVEYRLKQTGAGTLLTQVSEFQWKRLPFPLQRALAFGVRRDVTAQLRDLKGYLERR